MNWERGGAARHDARHGQVTYEQLLPQSLNRTEGFLTRSLAGHQIPLLNMPVIDVQAAGIQPGKRVEETIKLPGSQTWRHASAVLAAIDVKENFDMCRGGVGRIGKHP